MPDSAELFGEMADNLRSGQGKQRFSGGSVFEGTGRVIRPLARAGQDDPESGDYYEGDWF